MYPFLMGLEQQFALGEFGVNVRVEGVRLAHVAGHLTALGGRAPGPYEQSSCCCRLCGQCQLEPGPHL